MDSSPSRRPAEDDGVTSVVPSMKSLFIITQKGGNLILDYLPTLLAKTKIRVGGVAFLTWCPARFGRMGNTVLERIQIYGVRAWMMRQVIRLWGRARSPLRTHRLETILKTHAIPWLTIDNVNDSHFLDHLRQVAPDLVLSMFILQRFGSDLLSIPRTGCINLHLAHLPECRGLYSSFWSLYNGERESGVSVHFMNSDWDAGPIIAQRRFPISPGDTVRSLDRKKLAIMPGLLSDALDALIEGRVIPRENDPSRGVYYSVPSRQVLLAFRKERGGRWL